MAFAAVSPDRQWKGWTFKFAGKTIVLSARPITVPKGEKMPFSQALLPEFDEEMKNTRKILDCVPDGKFEYQPHE